MTKHGRQLKTQQQQHARQQQQQHKDQLAAAAAPPPPPTKQQQQQSSEPGATTFADTAAAADTTPAAGAETTAMAPAGAGAGGAQRGGDARIVTSLPGVPVTQERKVPVGLDAQLPHPGERALCALRAARPCVRALVGRGWRVLLGFGFGRERRWSRFRATNAFSPLAANPAGRP